MRRKERIGVVISEDDEDEYKEKPRFCEHCLTFELHMKLGPLRTEYGKEPKPDHDLFLECYHCGSIYPKFQTKSEQALEGFAEPSDNPFEDTTVFESAHYTRSSPKGKKALEKKKRERNRMHHHDKEIDELLRIYGEQNVKIHYDSMPDADTH
jgi:hypothetical protein